MGSGEGRDGQRESRLEGREGERKEVSLTSVSSSVIMGPKFLSPEVDVMVK